VWRRCGPSWGFPNVGPAALGQHRSTQRKIVRTREDEAALTADIIALAKTYGRYGYRRVTALLRNTGWTVNAKRVERIWRQEGLKVPQKQPKRGRLWLNDGSCVRLRPEWPNHVWAYDFVEDRTHDGRKFRMLCVIDEFTREALAIRVKRRLNSIDVLETLADLMILRGLPAFVRSNHLAKMDCRRRLSDRLYRARQSVGERLLRELQQQAARRTARRRDLLQPG
jgi:putative transposase